MKKVECNDLVPGCDYVAKGATEDEVMADVARHAREDHGIEVTPEVAAQARAAVRKG